MNISLEFSLKEKEKLYSLLKDKGFSFQHIDYAFFKAKKNGVIVILYKSGKLLIQGKEIENIFTLLKSTFFEAKRDPWMGTDEAGKGDYFGPLVVAGTIVEPKIENELLKYGIKDSKRLSPARIEELAGLIIDTLPYSVLVISPDLYNTLYEKKKNINLILKDAHIKVIEDLLKKNKVKRVVVDKFSLNSGIFDYFNDKIYVEEITQGERDIACASSSILARYFFDLEFKSMNAKYNFEFPKGAGERVREALRLFLKEYPKSELRNVAKLHFKLTGEVH